MSENLNVLQEIIREVFDDESLEVTPETSAEDIEDWDSLEHINVIIAVEKRFGIKFATAEISKLKDAGQNVGSFLDMIESKL